MTIPLSTSSVSSNNNSTQLFMLSNKEFDECKKTCERINDLISKKNSPFLHSFIKQSKSIMTESVMNFKHVIFKTSTLTGEENLKREDIEWNVITLPSSLKVLKNTVQNLSLASIKLEKVTEIVNKYSTGTINTFSDFSKTVVKDFDSLVKILEEGGKNAAINRNVLITANLDFNSAANIFLS